MAKMFMSPYKSLSETKGKTFLSFEMSLKGINASSVNRKIILKVILGFIT